jgi:hypothetical protein
MFIIKLSKQARILICVIVSIFCLNACENKQESAYSIKTIDLDNLSDISNNIDTVFFVKLEINSDAIISNQSCIRFYDSLIYVKNKREDKIFIFNRNGKYISTFDKLGQGTKEYMSIANYYVDEKGLSIYDPIKCKLLSYDHIGNLIGEIKLGEGESYFIKYKNKYVLYDDLSHNNKILLSIYDKDGNLTGKATMKYQTNQYFHLDYTPMSIVDDELFLVMLFDYKLYRLKDENINAQCLFDFKKYNLPINFREDNIKTKYLISEIQKQEKDKKVIYIDNITQCNNWIAAYIDGGKDNGFVFYSKNEDNLYTLKKLGMLFECFDNSISTDGEYFVTILQAHYGNMFKGLREQGVNLSKYDEQIANFDINDDDNPVLCFVKLKKNP